MEERHYDLVVIGSGPAGEKGAAQAAYFGKRTALIERSSHLGGAGINTGTIPSKTLRETALYFSGLRQRGLYGIDYSLKDDLTIEHLMYRKHSVVLDQWAFIRRNLEHHHIDLIQGEASLETEHSVRVKRPDGSDLDLSADVILIATGSSPYHPPEIPFDGVRVHDSDSILHMNRIPETMVVVGGGVIGSEYACVFTALGVQVTLVERDSRMLEFVDSEISERLRMKLELLGLDFRFADRVAEVVKTDKGVLLTLESGAEMDAGMVLFASGRHGCTQGLGLEKVGIQVNHRGVITVNEKYQTSVPNIYAAGDVIGFPALASVSMEQARVAMVHAFHLHYKESVSPVLPLAVYTIPEISMAGLTEDACREKNIPHVVGRSYYEQNARGQITGDFSGMLKLVFSPLDKTLLGVHMIGEDAAELIHIGTHVMQAGGTIDAFIEAVYNYPSLSDLYKYAAYDGLGNLRSAKQ